MKPMEQLERRVNKLEERLSIVEGNLTLKKPKLEPGLPPPLPEPKENNVIPEKKKNEYLPPVMALWLSVLVFALLPIQGFLDLSSIKEAFDKASLALA